MDMTHNHPLPTPPNSIPGGNPNPSASASGVPSSGPTATTTTTTTAASPLHSILPTLLQPLPSSPPDPPLPQPNNFDFLPPLHSLISKVHLDELSPQDLSHQANPIRVKLAKARQMVLDLPDISRGLDEQKVEIRELEERIEKQKKVIREALEVVRREMMVDATKNGSGGDAGVIKMELE